MPAAERHATHPSSTTGPELVKRAHALIPVLAEHTAEAKRRRKPVDSVIKALEEAEIYKLMVPKCYGGLELDRDTFFEVGVALGRGRRFNRLGVQFLHRTHTAGVAGSEVAGRPAGLT